MTTVELRPLAPEDLPALRDTAVADAAPSEVMPPVDGPGDDWTPTRATAFTDWQLTRITDPARRSYLITADGAPAGVIRLDDDGDATVALGYWIARSHRRRGLATRATALALTEAKALGMTGVNAQTTLANHGSRRVLETNGATLTVDGDVVRATFTL